MITYADHYSFCRYFKLFMIFPDTAEKQANGVKDSAELKAENVKSTNNREKDSPDEQNK